MMYIIVSLAMLIGLVALYVSSSAMKSVDTQSKDLSKRILTDQRTRFDELKAQIAKLEKRLSATEKKLSGLHIEDAGDAEPPRLERAEN